MNALIIVDLQNDFTSGGSLAVPHGDEIIPLVNSIQKQFDLVVATQDWHPKDHMSFASNHQNKKPFDVVKLNNLEQVLWPDHCIQGSRGAAFHDEFVMDNVAAIFRKGMDPEIDSYSGFFDNGHLLNTGLAGYLRDRNVTDVYVCGLAGDYCVYYTAIDAISEGFTTYFLSDATRSIDDSVFEKAKADILAKGGKMITSSQISVRKTEKNPSF
jgi:nicotinamidase/pyrazinamidase